MAKTINPAATDHLPFFITPPGGTDILLYVVAGFLILVVFIFGLYTMRLYWYPAQRSHKVQFEIVAFLALLGLLTVNPYLWLAALLLALVQVPDFSTPINRMDEALAKLSATRQRQRKIEPPLPLRPALPHTKQLSGSPKGAGQMEDSKV